MLPKPMTLALGAVAAVIGYSLWESNRPTGDKARVGDKVLVPFASTGLNVPGHGPIPGLPVSGADWMTVLAEEPGLLVGIPSWAADNDPALRLRVPRSAVQRIERDGRQFA